VARCPNRRGLDARGWLAVMGFNDANGGARGGGVGALGVGDGEAHLDDENLLRHQN